MVVSTAGSGLDKYDGNVFHPFILHRLLRLVQTLESMSRKTGRPMMDVMPHERLNELWGSLENALLQMKEFLEDSSGFDSAEKSEKQITAESVSGSSRPQTALVSVLNRLLPVTEAFFLVYTSDVLSAKINSKKEGAPSPEKVENSVPISGNLRSPPSPSVPLTSSNLMQQDSSLVAATSAVLAATASPGYRYRCTEEYLRNNLSLFPSPEVEEDRPASMINSFSLSLMRSSSSSTSLPSSGSLNASRAHRLLSFVTAHRGLLNLLVKSKPSLLDGSFAGLVRVTQLRYFLSFENKRTFFFAQLKRLSASGTSAGRRPLTLQIRRQQVFEDSYHQMRARTPEEMKGRLQLNFYGEEGVDAGGLTREWCVTDIFVFVAPE